MRSRNGQCSQAVATFSLATCHQFLPLALDKSKIAISVICFLGFSQNSVVIPLKALRKAQLLVMTTCFRLKDTCLCRSSFLSHFWQSLTKKCNNAPLFVFVQFLASAVLSNLYRYEAGNGFHIVAAHTDSPCPKLKPVSAATKAGFLNVGVQTYGGGLWHTWFDRDLSVAGRVLLRRNGGSVMQELVKVERPIMRIPTLAIHLDRHLSTHLSSCLISDELVIEDESENICIRIKFLNLLLVMSQVQPW